VPKKISMYIRDKHEVGKLPEWQRMYGLSDEGTVYLPGSFLGNEKAAYMMAIYDGASVIVRDGHYYFDADWIASEIKPEHAQDVMDIAEKIRENHNHKDNN